MPRTAPKAAGRRSVTLADVAALARVSQMTVSRVVNGSHRVSDATRDRVRAAMDELGYIPNQFARGLAVGGSRLIALIVADITHPWFTQVAHAIEVEAAKRGYTVVVANSDDDPVVERSYLEKLGSLQVDGVILAPAGDRAAENVPLLARNGVRFVLLDRAIRGIDADLVSGESVRATRALTDHLVKVHGHVDIAMVAGPAKVSTSRDRVRSFRATLRANGIEPRNDWILSGAYSREWGREATGTLLAGKPRPTAIVAANSFIAFGVLDAARERGLRVPEDLALVTFDDIEITVEPFLTCAERPPRAVGEKALEYLLGRLEGDQAPPREHVVPAEVRIRRSCGCPGHGG